MALFESYERRIAQINKFLNDNGIASIEEAEQITKGKGLDIYQRVKDIQPICFENACWAYLVGAAVAIKRGQTVASEIAKTLGEGLQSFCIPGSVADDRKVGIGHGNLASMLLEDQTKCFAFCAGHESFAAAEGAIGLARSANKARKEPLRVILNGLGKDAAMIISRINGFTFVETEFDYATGELKVVAEKAYSKGERAAVRCYGADDVREGVAIMWNEDVDIAITGNSPHYNIILSDLQERTYRQRQKVLLCGIRRRHGQNPAPGQHGSRSCFLRHDGHHGQNALRRTVRRFLLGSGTRRNDGSHRHGQQPHGRCVR